MASTPAIYQHTPLDLTRRQVRLLRLRPNALGKVDGSLHIFDRWRMPRYQALSYAWGLAEPTRYITIDDAHLYIRPNLDDFLRVYARQSSIRNVSGLGDQFWSDLDVAPFGDMREYEYLWIDQICIDQSSNQERNHQVQQMGSIFSGADRLLVWLGLQQNDFCISALFQSDINRYELSSDEQTAWERMLLAPYWRRHWVLQELLLGKEGIVVYGENTIAFEKLLTRWSSWRTLVRGSDDHVLSIFDMRRIGGWHFLSFLFVGRIMAAQTFCEDPRDKIYGLHSVLPLDLRIEVDYNKTVEEVFLDFAVRCYECQLEHGAFKAPTLQVARAMGLISQSQTPHMKQLLSQTEKWFLDEVKIKQGEQRDSEQQQEQEEKRRRNQREFTSMASGTRSDETIANRAKGVRTMLSPSEKRAFFEALEAARLKFIHYQGRHIPEPPILQSKSLTTEFSVTIRTRLLQILKTITGDDGEGPRTHVTA